MRYHAFTLKTLADAEDIVIASLADAGVEGVEIVDKVPLSDEETRQMFVDVPPQPAADDGIAYLRFYLEEGADVPAMLGRVRQELDGLRPFLDIGEGTVTEELTEDTDWINNWKAYFHQFVVDGIRIVPSWEVPEGDGAEVLLRIDPGTAFGTGLHETTQLCLRQIKRYCTPGCRILDVGTGSGILSIAALKLGAGHAIATDLDPSAIAAVRENMQANDIGEDALEVSLGNLADDPCLRQAIGAHASDLVVANILAEVLVDLTPVIAGLMKPGAIYITSGILREKQDLVEAAVRACGMQVLDVSGQGEWVCVTARKNG